LDGRTRPIIEFLILFTCGTQIISIYFLEPKLKVLHGNQEQPNISFFHGTKLMLVYLGYENR
jgi:hypothetical protein